MGTSACKMAIECLEKIYEMYNNRILCMLIFGSRSDSSHKEGSDTDILIIFKDNVPVDDVLSSLDVCLSERNIVYDCGWYRISDLKSMIEKGEDWFILYNILKSGVMVCGDKKLLSELREQVSRIDAIKAIRETLRSRLRRNIALKHAMARNLRTLLLNVALLDFIRLKGYIPSYSELLCWVLSADSTLNAAEKEILLNTIRIIKARKDVCLSAIEVIEQMVIKRCVSVMASIRSQEQSK